MHFVAFNRIRFNKQLSHLIAKGNKKKYNSHHVHNKFVRSYTNGQQPNKDPFPSWQAIAILSSIGIYQQYLIYDQHCGKQ
jgi:hypothetical protein